MKTKSIKFALHFSFFLFALFTLVDKSHSLSNYQIRKICEKEKRELTCIRNLQEKRIDLQKGNKIEIPIKPFKSI